LELADQFLAPANVVTITARCPDSTIRLARPSDVCPVGPTAAAVPKDPKQRTVHAGNRQGQASYAAAQQTRLAQDCAYVDREMSVPTGMFVILAHLGLVVWSLDLLEQLWNGAHRRSFQWLLLGTSLAWFGQQIVVGHFAA
jgi:hypothetical protein